MPEDKKENTQVNVSFVKHPELYKDLQQMIDDDGVNQSIFIRNLIKQEKLRRAEQSPLPISKPNRKTNSASVAALAA